MQRGTGMSEAETQENIERADYLRGVLASSVHSFSDGQDFVRVPVARDLDINWENPEAPHGSVPIDVHEFRKKPCGWWIKGRCFDARRIECEGLIIAAWYDGDDGVVQLYDEIGKPVPR